MNNYRTILFSSLAILFSGICTFANAQSVEDIAQKFKKRTHTFEQTTLPYRLFIPENYNPQKSYPIMLCLHGAGERDSINDDYYIVKHNLAVSWANNEIQSKNPCFIVAPRCPKTQKWNYVNFKYGTCNIDTIPIGKELLAVVNLMDNLLGEFNIDINRQYVTGLSMGGYGTWDIIARYPERFAAAVPMSGAGDTSKVVLFKNLSIWFFHNTNDQIVPVSGSRDMLKTMNNSGIKVVETMGMKNRKLGRKIKNGATHLYTESPEGNHGPWEPWYGDPYLHQWVFSKSNQLIVK